MYLSVKRWENKMKTEYEIREGKILALEQEIEDNIEEAEKEGYDYLETSEGKSKKRYLNELRGYE